MLQAVTLQLKRELVRIYRVVHRHFVPGSCRGRHNRGLKAQRGGDGEVQAQSLRQIAGLLRRIQLRVRQRLDRKISLAVMQFYSRANGLDGDPTKLSVPIFVRWVIAERVICGAV